MMRFLLRATPLFAWNFRTVKKWLAIASATLVITLALVGWGLFAAWDLMMDRLDASTGGNRVIEFVAQESKGTLIELREKAQGLTDSLDKLLGKDSLPQRDVGGEDIGGIPRYPGMVRVAYRNVEGRRMITYAGRHDLAQVLQFYRDEAQRAGWTITVVEATSDLEIHRYARDGRRVAATLSRAAGKDLTTVVIEEHDS